MKLPDSPPVLVVGGGPAGSTVAILLARLGREVLLVDRARFPRAKACGECLNPGGVEALERLGLLGVVEATDPHPLLGWTLRSPGTREVRTRFGPKAGPALGIRRDRFDLALLDEARRLGVGVAEGVQVMGVDPDPDRPQVTLRGPGRLIRTVRPRILVGADGLRSTVARAAGAIRRRAGPVRTSLSWRLRGPPSMERAGTLFLGEPFTAGLAPVRKSPTGTEWSLTVVVDPAPFRELLRSDPTALAAAALEELHPGPGAPTPPDRTRRPQASGPFHWPARWVSRGAILLVGDAAGYFDPLTGQGIFRALRGAEMAAPAIDSTLKEMEDSGGSRIPRRSLERYEVDHRRAFQAGRRIQFLVDRTLSRPLSRALALAFLGRAPRKADALIRVIGDRASSWTLMDPRLWLPALPPTTTHPTSSPWRSNADRG
jgi:menaquinone-9 beta-reductase